MKVLSTYQIAGHTDIPVSESSKGIPSEKRIVCLLKEAGSVAGRSYICQCHTKSNAVGKVQDCRICFKKGLVLCILAIVVQSGPFNSFHIFHLLHLRPV